MNKMIFKLIMSLKISKQLDVVGSEAEFLSLIGPGDPIFVNIFLLGRC